MSSSARKFRDITAFVDKNQDSVKFLRFLKENATVELAHKNMTKVLVHDDRSNCPPAVAGKRLPMLYCAMLRSYIVCNDVYDFVQAYPRLVMEHERKTIAARAEPSRPAPQPPARHAQQSSAPPDAVAAASGMAGAGAIGARTGRAQASMAVGRSFEDLFDQGFDDIASVNPRNAEQNEHLQMLFQKEQEEVEKETQSFMSRMHVGRTAR